MGCVPSAPLKPVKVPQPELLNIKSIDNSNAISIENNPMIEKYKKDVEDIKFSFDRIKEAFDDEKQKYKDSVQKMVEEFEHYKLTASEIVEDKQHEIRSLKARLRHNTMKST